MKIKIKKAAVLFFKLDKLSALSTIPVSSSPPFEGHNHSEEDGGAEQGSIRVSKSSLFTLLSTTEYSTEFARKPLAWTRMG